MLSSTYLPGGSRTRGAVDRRLDHSAEDETQGAMLGLSSFDLTLTPPLKTHQKLVDRAAEQTGKPRRGSPGRDDGIRDGPAGPHKSCHGRTQRPRVVLRGVGFAACPSATRAGSHRGLTGEQGTERTACSPVCSSVF